MNRHFHRKVLLRLAAAALSVACLAGIAFWAGHSAKASPTAGAASATAARTLEPVHKLSHPAVSESSGLVASPRITGLFWTLNDSGDGPFIYPINSFGEQWPGSPKRGIEVRGARNVDWEDLTFDGQGRIVVADVGNNANERRDLTLYYLREPDPAETFVEVLRAVRIEWPEQLAFPPAERNFDCEAVFWASGRVHFLMKHRADDQTTLYRLDRERGFPEPSRPVRIGSFPIGGMVTAADASPDGLQLAVLTYGAIWLFERPDTEANFLDHPTRRLSIRAWQCEAIAFDPDGSHLWITNEQRSIYKVALQDLPILVSGSIH